MGRGAEPNTAAAMAAELPPPGAAAAGGALRGAGAALFCTAAIGGPGVRGAGV